MLTNGHHIYAKFVNVSPIKWKTENLQELLPTFVNPSWRFQESLKLLPKIEGATEELKKQVNFLVETSPCRPEKTPQKPDATVPLHYMKLANSVISLSL